MRSSSIQLATGSCDLSKAEKEFDVAFSIVKTFCMIDASFLK